MGAAASGGQRDEGWWDVGHQRIRNEEVAPLILLAYLTRDEGRGTRDEEWRITPPPASSAFNET